MTLRHGMPVAEDVDFRQTGGEESRNADILRHGRGPGKSHRPGGDTRIDDAARGEWLVADVVAENKDVFKCSSESGSKIESFNARTAEPSTKSNRRTERVEEGSRVALREEKSVSGGNANVR